MVPFRRQHTYYNVTASPGHIIKQGRGYMMFFSAADDSRGLHRTIGIARTRSTGRALERDPRRSFRGGADENTSLYFEPANKTWFLFTNHLGLEGEEYTDAVWVYWTKDLNKWNPDHKAVVLDGKNCDWSRKCIGLPGVLKCATAWQCSTTHPAATARVT